MVWLGRVERRLDSMEGDRGGSVVCVSAALGPILSLVTRARVDIYVCVLHLTNIISMYSMEEEDAADTRLIHRREYCSPFSPLSSACTRIGRSSRPISYAGISISFYSSRIRKEKLFQNFRVYFCIRSMKIKRKRNLYKISTFTFSNNIPKLL